MAKEKKEKENGQGCCAKCSRVCFNITLLISFIFFMLIVLMYSQARNWHFAMQPDRWSLLEGLCEFFIVAFGILYFWASMTIFVRFYQKRRLCRMDNCSFYIFTVGILALSLLGLKYVNQSVLEQELDFSQDCAQLKLTDALHDSFLAEVN